MMTDRNIKLITGGSDFTIIYKYNGDMMLCGKGYLNQLGIFLKILIIQSLSFFILIIGNNKLENYCRPFLLMNDPEIKKISCGSDHT